MRILSHPEAEGMKDRAFTDGAVKARLRFHSIAGVKIPRNKREQRKLEASLTKRRREAPPGGNGRSSGRS